MGHVLVINTSTALMFFYCQKSKIAQNNDDLDGQIRSGFGGYTHFFLGSCGLFLENPHEPTFKKWSFFVTSAPKRKFFINWGVEFVNLL